MPGVGQMLLLLPKARDNIIHLYQNNHKKITTMKSKHYLYTFIFILLSFTCSYAQVITAEKFKEKLSTEKPMLVDVRTPGEFDAEKIEGSVNMNVNDSLVFLRQIAALDKTKTYLLYCGMGKRSAKASGIMTKNGFTKIFQLEGGLEEWKKKGFKVTGKTN